MIEKDYTLCGRLKEVKIKNKEGVVVIRKLSKNHTTNNVSILHCCSHDNLDNRVVSSLVNDTRRLDK